MRTRIRRLAPAAVLTAGLAVACSAAAQNDVARGQQIVQEKCSRCHATGKADASPNPKAPPFRIVGRIYPVEHLAEALAEGISTGAPEMPQFKFDPRDVDAIIDYLNAMAAERPAGKDKDKDKARR